MAPSQKCYDIIKQFEGCKLKSYQDSALVWTIGWGTIMYPSGVRVKPGETITQAQADQYLQHEIDLKAKSVNAFTSHLGLKQQQFDALVSFAYNVGVGALQKSTLLKVIKANPNDPTIETQFLRWNKAGGKALNGLTKRRQAESDLYFS